MQVYTKHTLASRFIPSEKVFHNPAVSTRNRKLFPFPERKKRRLRKAGLLPRGEIVKYSKRRNCDLCEIFPPATSLPLSHKGLPLKKLPPEEKIVVEIV